MHILTKCALDLTIRTTCTVIFAIFAGVEQSIQLASGNIQSPLRNIQKSFNIGLPSPQGTVLMRYPYLQ